MTRIVEGRAASAVGGLPDVIIHRRTGYDLKRLGSYPAWPWVTRAAAGRLVCVFREGLRHNHKPPPYLPEQVMFTDSADEGRTWSPAGVLAGSAEEFCRNAAIGCLPDGSLLLVYGAFRPASETVAAKAICSSDGGQTWNEPVTIAQNCGTRAAPVAISTGDLLVPMYGPSHGDPAEGGQARPGNVIAARSADSGRMWEMHEVPNPESLPEDEWGLCGVEKGRIIGITHFRHRCTAAISRPRAAIVGGRGTFRSAPTSRRRIRRSGRDATAARPRSTCTAVRLYSPMPITGSYRSRWSRRTIPRCASGMSTTS